MLTHQILHLFILDLSCSTNSTLSWRWSQCWANPTVNQHFWCVMWDLMASSFQIELQKQTLMLIFLSQKVVSLAIQHWFLFCVVVRFWFLWSFAIVLVTHIWWTCIAWDLSFENTGKFSCTNFTPESTAAAFVFVVNVICNSACAFDTNAFSKLLKVLVPSIQWCMAWGLASNPTAKIFQLERPLLFLGSTN